MKNICIVVAFFAAQLNAQIVVQGSISNMPLSGVRQLSLECWNIDRWQQKAVVYIDPDNTFSSPLMDASPGQYRLRMWGESKMWNDFVVADSAMADTALTIPLDYEHLDGGPVQVKGSLANDLYYRMLHAQWQINKQGDNAAATAAQIDALQTDLNSFCLETAAKYPKTLIGDIAMLLYLPDRTDYRKDAAVSKMTANEFAKAYGLDKIAFHHDNILFHNAFTKRLNGFYNYFDHDATGWKAYIDGIMARRNGNDLVDAFLFKYLLDKTMDNREEDALAYLLKWYAPDCTDESPLPNGVVNLIEALKTCAPGNIVPEQTFINFEGQPSALGDACAHHKITLMLFWRSTCSHCKEFEPELQKIYKKYHPLGLEVYALSLDKSEDEWRQDLQKNPTPWVNIFIPIEKRKDINKTFPAPSTPALIALDKNRRVLNRMVSRGNLEVYLDDVLHKME